MAAQVTVTPYPQMVAQVTVTHPQMSAQVTVTPYPQMVAKVTVTLYPQMSAQVTVTPYPQMVAQVRVTPYPQMAAQLQILSIHSAPPAEYCMQASSETEELCGDNMQEANYRRQMGNDPAFQTHTPRR